jgi:hypothetical protein
MRYPDSIIIGL